jgi:hypothetical protein
MALFDKMGRLASLAGIVAFSLGSLVVSACSGKTRMDGESDLTEEETADAEDDSGLDAPLDPPADEAASDDAPEEPDTDMWEELCE